MEELEEAERELVGNSRLMEAYTSGFAYHPAHAVIAYYWGALGIDRLEKTIAVGNNPCLTSMGFEIAKNMDEAIKILKEYGCSEIAYISIPPIFFAY